MAKLDLTVDAEAEFEHKLVDAYAAAGLVESGDLVWMLSAHRPLAPGGRHRGSRRP